MMQHIGVNYVRGTSSTDARIGAAPANSFALRVFFAVFVPSLTIIAAVAIVIGFGFSAVAMVIGFGFSAVAMVIGFGFSAVCGLIAERNTVAILSGIRKIADFAVLASAVALSTLIVSVFVGAAVTVVSAWSCALSSDIVIGDSLGVILVVIAFRLVSALPVAIGFAGLTAATDVGTADFSFV